MIEELVRLLSLDFSLKTRITNEGFYTEYGFYAQYFRMLILTVMWKRNELGREAPLS